MPPAPPVSVLSGGEGGGGDGGIRDEFVQRMAMGGAGQSGGRGVQPSEPARDLQGAPAMQ